MFWTEFISKEDINKILVPNKFYALTDDNKNSVEANILLSMKRKPTYSKEEQILINQRKRKRQVRYY